MSQTQVLYDLQQLDNEIRAGKQRLGEVLRAQREPEALLSARRAAEQAAGSAHQWRTRHMNLNLELGSVNDKARRSEQRLYSGNVKNPKELTDLQHEVEALGRRRAVLEDDLLEALIGLEESEAARKAADEELSRLTAEWETTLSDLKREQNTLALRLNELTQRRERQAALADARLLTEYDRLVKQKGGVAVAGLRNNKCQGCQVTISANTVKAANEGRIVHCDNCDRILNPL